MSDGLNVNVKPRLIVVPRLNVLTTAISEFAAAFGAKADCIESIKKGVLERQILKKVYLSYYNKQKFVGRITLEIDWNTHRVMLNSSDGQNFKLRTDRSVIEQLDAASNEIIQHVERMKAACGVTRVESSYIYTDEYNHDPEKEKEAMSFLGHHHSNANSIERSAEEFKTHISFIAGKLKELKITVEC